MAIPSSYLRFDQLTTTVKNDATVYASPDPAPIQYTNAQAIVAGTTEETDVDVP